MQTRLVHIQRRSRGTKWDFRWNAGTARALKAKKTNGGKKAETCSQTGRLGSPRMFPKRKREGH